MFNDFFLNILIIGTFLLLTGYIFRRKASELGVSIKIRIIAGLGTGHLAILLINYPIHIGQNVIDLSNLLYIRLKEMEETDVRCSNRFTKLTEDQNIKNIKDTLNFNLNGRLWGIMN